MHDVLEHIREEAELAELLEVALGRWDPDRPPPDSEPGREYREHLAREIAAVRGHPDYRALDDVPGRRRELEFIYLASPDGFLQGAIDLAAPAGDGGIAALDVKTGGGDAEALKRKADGYALQRSVYVGALEAIGGRPVTSFAFHFAADGVQIGGPVSAELRRRRRRSSAALAAMGAEAPALTRYPAECRFCGYRRERWCEGVK